MDAKNLAMILCFAALVAMFLGWNKRSPAAVVTLGPAVTMTPATTLAPVAGTLLPALAAADVAVLPTAAPIVVTPAVTARPFA